MKIVTISQAKTIILIIVELPWNFPRQQVTIICQWQVMNNHKKIKCSKKQNKLQAYFSQKMETKAFSKWQLTSLFRSYDVSRTYEQLLNLPLFKRAMQHCPYQIPYNSHQFNIMCHSNWDAFVVTWPGQDVYYYLYGAVSEEILHNFYHQIKFLEESFLASNFSWLLSFVGYLDLHAPTEAEDNCHSYYFYLALVNVLAE
jgi:hypothetical protein